MSLVCPSYGLGTKACQNCIHEKLHLVLARFTYDTSGSYVDHVLP